VPSGGAKNIFFLGTGGAAILMQPASLLLQRRSTFPAYMEIAAEFVAGGHQALGGDSIVVIPSLSGTTKESVATLDYCKEKGATIIALVGHKDTPLGKQGRPCLRELRGRRYVVRILLSAIAADRAFGDGASRRVCGLREDGRRTSTLPRHLVAAKQMFEPEAERIATAFTR
jgi:fructoselysine-6-phosphate deglycase